MKNSIILWSLLNVEANKYQTEKRISYENYEQSSYWFYVIFKFCIASVTNEVAIAKSQEIMTRPLTWKLELLTIERTGNGYHLVNGYHHKWYVANTDWMICKVKQSTPHDIMATLAGIVFHSTNIISATVCIIMLATRMLWGRCRLLVFLTVTKTKLAIIVMINVEYQGKTPWMEGPSSSVMLVWWLSSDSEQGAYVTDSRKQVKAATTLICILLTVNNKQKHFSTTAFIQTAVLSNSKPI